MASAIHFEWTYNEILIVFFIQYMYKKFKNRMCYYYHQKFTHKYNFVFLIHFNIVDLISIPEATQKL